MCGWDVLVKGWQRSPLTDFREFRPQTLSLRGIVNNSCWRSVLYNLASLLSHWVLLRPLLESVRSFIIPI